MRVFGQLWILTLRPAILPTPPRSRGIAHPQKEGARSGCQTKLQLLLFSRRELRPLPPRPWYRVLGAPILDWETLWAPLNDPYEPGCEIRNQFAAEAAVLAESQGGALATASAAPVHVLAQVDEHEDVDSGAMDVDAGLAPTSAPAPAPVSAERSSSSDSDSEDAYMAQIES